MVIDMFIFLKLQSDLTVKQMSINIKILPRPRERLVFFWSVWYSCRGFEKLRLNLFLTSIWKKDIIGRNNNVGFDWVKLSNITYSK